MHPNVARFIEEYEKQAEEKGSYRRTIGRAERLFLEKVWGPVFQFTYDGLQAEYPLKDFKGGERFADFVYMKGGARVLVEIDGFTTHARDISPGDFDDHLQRQNDLVLSGWLLLRFSAHQVEKRFIICQRQLQQAIGHWWSIHQQEADKGQGSSLWDVRRNQALKLAYRHDGVVRTREFAQVCNISLRTAHRWLGKFANEGTLVPQRLSKRVSGYRLANSQSAGG